MGTRLLAAATTIAMGVTVLIAPSSEAAPLQTAATARLALPPVRVQLAADDKKLVAGEHVRLTARLLDAVSAAPVAGEELTLQWRRLGSDEWMTGSTSVTDGSGRTEWPGVTRTYSARYRVVHRESAAYASGRSDDRTVLVQPALQASLNRDWVTPSGSVRLTGRVRLAYPGERVQLQRRADGRWVTVRRAEQGARGRFAFAVGGWSTYGPQRYRVLLPERRDHLGAVSRTVELRTVRVVTYRIETRGDIVVSMKEFRERTDQIYADPRGWSRANVHFKRVRTGGAFSLVLSEASYVPNFAPICDRYWSCRVGRYVIINQNRWRWGTPYFKSAGGNLREYRAMVVNHETGHWFGLGHASCGGAGRPAPVMMQQSKGLYGCEPNPWPLRWEIARAY